MSVFYRKSAVKDLRVILNFVRERNPNAAIEVITKVLDTLDLLDHFPKLGRKGLVAGTRELAIADTPYVAVYRVVARRVEVVAVYHGAQSR